MSDEQTLLEMVKANPHKQASVTVRWQAGLLAKKKIKGELRRGCLDAGVDVQIASDGGWLMESCTARITGEARRVWAFAKAWREYKRKLEAI